MCVKLFESSRDWAPGLERAGSADWALVVVPDGERMDESGKVYGFSELG